MNSLLESIQTHPKGLILFLIAFLNIFWISYVVLIKKNFRKPLYKIYLIYAAFTVIWTISNAYFQSGLLGSFSEEFAKKMALLANISGSFSVLGFMYISFLMLGDKKNVSKPVKGFIFLWSTIVLLFNFIPNLTVKEVHIFENGAFELIFGEWNNYFFIATIAIIMVSMANFVIAIKRRPAFKIETARFYYILLGMSLMFLSLIMFTLVLPAFFSVYNYVWLPPLFSILEVLIVGYAIVTKRFLDIRLLISTGLKIVFSFAIALFTGYLFHYFFEGFFKNSSFFYLHIGSSIVFLVTYYKSQVFLNSHSFQRYLGLTNTEFIRKIIAELKTKNKVYTSIEELEKELRSMFPKQAPGRKCCIIILNKKTQIKYSELVKYFREKREILVTEEIRFMGEEEDANFPFIQELESLGGVCVPLYHPSKGLIGFFALGQKTYNHLYTKNEIEALERLGNYIGLMVTEILYSSELKKEVQRKTIELRQKVKEKNELVKQQSDFIAVTAHEFRTPLSVALFQLDDIARQGQRPNHLKENLDRLESSLNNLKELTQKLFAVQQYDLNKVKLNKEKVDLKQFIEQIYQECTPLVNEHKLEFKLNNKLKKHTWVEIDRPQIRQVLHNLITNACKFTHEGSVTLSASEKEGDVLICIIDTGKGIPDGFKKSVFSKFRTNSTGAGIGLGLYICQKIIELHEGRIWAEDTPQGGATFCIQLKN